MREDDTGDLGRGDGRGSWRRVEKDDESRIFLVPAIFDLVFTSLNISREGSSSLLAHWRKSTLAQEIGRVTIFWLQNPYDSGGSGGITVPAHRTREGEGLETNRKDTTRPHR